MNGILLSVLVPVEYSVDDAADWVRRNGGIVRKVHTTGEYHRFRQHTIIYANKRGYTDIKTISIGDNGISVIVAYPTPLQGAGIITDASNLIFGATGYSTQQQKLIDKYATNTVVSIRFGRTPLPFLLTKVLEAFTLGAYQSLIKAAGFDKLYHLFAILTLDNGTTILLEKNSTINIKEVSGYNPPKAEYTQPISTNVAFKELLDKTQSKQGAKYFKYSVFTNNCQIFLMDMLKANNLLTPTLKTFIYQNPADLFARLK
jgi:hypothetical protein